MTVLGTRSVAVLWRVVLRYLASEVLRTAANRPWRSNEELHSNWIQCQCELRPVDRAAADCACCCV